VLLAVHVAAAVTGFGAIAATGAFAHEARTSEAPFHSRALARYFRPGHNLAARAIYLVPVAGGGLLALGHGGGVGAAWPWIGLALWVLAVSVATSTLWPAEAELQRLLLQGPEGEAAVLLGPARRLERSAAVCSVLFVAALAVMVVQPR